MSCTISLLVKVCRQCSTICLPASPLSKGLSSAGVKHNVRRRIFKNEDGAPAKTVRGSLARHAYRSLPGFVSMFTGLGGKVAPSSDLNIFIGLYVHVCSGERAGIVVEYRGSDSLVEVKRGSYSSLLFFAEGGVVSSSIGILPCDACRSGSGSVLVEQTLQLEHV